MSALNSITSGEWKIVEAVAIGIATYTVFIWVLYRCFRFLDRRYHD